MQGGYMNSEELLMKYIDNIPANQKSLDQWHDNFLVELQVYMRGKGIDSAEILSLLIGLISMNSNGLTPEHAHLNLVSTYCKSNGFINEFLSRIVGDRDSESFTSQNLTSNKRPIFTYIEHKKSEDQITSELINDGYSRMPFCLSQEVVEELNNFAKQCDYDFRDIFAPNRSFTFSSPNCVMAEIKKTHLYENQLVMDIARSKEITEIARKYLGAHPLLFNMQMWYSFPHPSGIGQSESAQLFHFDLDGIKWVKFFIHLNDVNDSNGMHYYVPGTHRVGGKNRDLLARGYTRISDQDMSNLQFEKSTPITAKAGDIVCGDTKCFHKGSELKNGHRLIMQIQYSINRFSQNYGVQQ